MKTKPPAQEEAPFADISALIEKEKAAALAAFDPQAFRAGIQSRLGDRRRPAWARSPGLVAACVLALLLATWALLPPGPGPTHRSIDVHVVERALVQAAAWRTAGPVPTPAEPALSDEVWKIERALLTWRREQRGNVDVERALCLAAGRSGSSRACPSYAAEDVAAPGVRQRLERTLLELERDGTIYRVLVDRRRT